MPTKTKRKTSTPTGRTKVKKVMHEFKHHTLKGGKGKHPKVTSRKQAVAIALSEAREAGAKIPKKRSSKK